MKKWMTLPLTGLTATVLLISGCNREATPTVPAEAVPLVAAGEGIVVAEGRVEPARWVEMSAPAEGGTIADVAVTEGEAILEGDLLVAFDPRDAELAVEKAEALLTQAEAQLARVMASPRSEDIAVTEARLEVAHYAVAEAEARRDRLVGGETDADVAAAQASLAAAAAEEKQAFYLHERTMECFNFEWGGEKHTICPALGPPEEAARHAWQASQDSLGAAEAQLASARNQASTRLRTASAELSAAVAQERAQQARLDLQRAPALADEIAGARASVAQAEASLLAAREALADTALRAPFAATVVEISVDAGDAAAPGQVLVVLATLDQMVVRTQDLIELDVVKVSVDKPATIKVDALPDRTFEGEVIRIDEQPEDYRGDVIYPVVIRPLDPAPELRWGMTTSVEIDVR